MEVGPGSLACLSKCPRPTCCEGDGDCFSGMRDLWYLLPQWPLPPVTQYVALE